ncbi:MAG: hypothetical protein R3Y68_07815 [Rikenellaceae bacterium]
MRNNLLITLLATTIASSTYATQPITEHGVETTTSDYFEQIYLYNDLVQYLDQKNLHITYQAETTGEYNSPDRMVFSIDGNSFRWNKYYIDGFRVDSRYFAGSSLYKTNMSNYDLALDYISSTLSFTTSESRREMVGGSINVGSLGGMSRGTSDFIRLLHATATDRAYKPIEERSHIKGAGTVDLNFAVEGKDGKQYMQSAYFNVGQREMVGFNYSGIYKVYPEKYGTLQIGGELAATFGSLFDQTNYIASFAQRSHLNSEFYFGEAESAALKSYNASLYGSKRVSDMLYTSGISLSINSTKHEDLNYSRNIVDHDGEGFEPWQPDGSNFELSHSLTLSKRLNDWLNLSVDTYNTLLYFTPSQSSFENEVYAQFTTQENPTMLYLYEWQSNAFASALLENSVSVNTTRQLTPDLTLEASLGVSLDAMIVDDNSRLSPNFEASASLEYRPKRWLQAGFSLSRERVNYNIDDIRFLSSDYLSGEVYYLDQNSSKGGLFTTTGGAYHTLSKSAKQPTYYVVDIPIFVTLGRHTLTMLHSYRKYCNNWSVTFDGDYTDYGSIVSCNTEESGGTTTLDATDIFFYDGGKRIDYLVGNYNEESMGGGFFTSTPFGFCSNIEYTYTAPKFIFSLGWQSYMVGGITTLGNGPLHNNIGSLSESSANPNTSQVMNNSQSSSRGGGRLDQDRGYIARIFASYAITPKLSVAMNAKFKDGQPFSIFHAEYNTAGDQVAVVPVTSRGTNPNDANFGTREDGVYNVDVRVKYRTTIARRNCEFGAYCYNIYDFGNELTEYIFDQDINGGRCAMSLTIPRGLIFSFSMDL